MLILCSANVCRSPAAQVLLTHHLRQRGTARDVRVTSAGTEVGAPGRRPDPRVAAIVAEAGLSIRGIRARPVTAKQLVAADRIWVMEHRHEHSLREQFPEVDLGIELLHPAAQEIGDPFFGSRADVRETFDLLAEVTFARARELTQELAPPPENVD